MIASFVAAMMASKVEATFASLLAAMIQASALSPKLCKVIGP
jgi:hypothetical protein